MPYVKLFLASQTNSTTADVLGALQQCRTRADGFLLWGYNPGHSYQGQDYDHAAILQALLAMHEKPKR